MKDKAAREFLSYIGTEARRLRRVEGVERMVVPCALIETLCSEATRHRHELAQGTRDKLFGLQCELLAETSNKVVDEFTKILDEVKAEKAKKA